MEELISHEEVINLGEKPYELKEFFSMNGFLPQNVNLSNFHSAIAKFGGPIALMVNKTLPFSLTQNKALNEEVCFFSSDGKMINSTRINYSDEVICFEFIQNELLLIVTNGVQDKSNPLKAPQFFLLDPFHKSHKAQAFQLDTKFAGKIHSVRVFENSFAFVSKVLSSTNVEEMRFYYVENLHTLSQANLNVTEKPFAKSGLKEAPRDWIVIQRDNSVLQSLEIQVAHPECGIISITESQAQQYYIMPEPATKTQQKKVSNLPPIKNIQLIAIAPSSSLIAYLQQHQQFSTEIQFFFDNREVGNGNIKLCVVSNDYEASTFRASDVDIKDFKLFANSSKPSQLKMIWCGDHCCILQGEKQFLMIGPNVSENVNLDKHFILSTEVDGLRVQTKESSKMLRLLPTSYINIYSSAYLKLEDEIKPSAQLLLNYQNLKNKEPFDDSGLRNNTNQLKQAVSECMSAAEFAIEDEKQEELLKAASYGKTYIGPESNYHDQFGNLCVKLRVVYNFKEQSIRRMITCAQVSHLLSGELQQQLINIMLRYDYHELAINVCGQLDFKQKVKTQIFEHWAERVIEKSSHQFRKDLKNKSQQSERVLGSCLGLLEAEDERAAAKIIKKLQSEKNISFINIAKRAMKEGRQKLASLLLEQEPSAFKRVPVLILMGKNCEEFERTTLRITNIDGEEEVNNKLNSEEWPIEVEKKQKEHFQKALEEALKSRDSELLYKCLKEMDQSMKNQKLKFDIAKSRMVFANHYKNFLKKSLDPAKQNRYKEFLKELDKSCNNPKMQSDLSLEKGLYLVGKGLEVKGNYKTYQYLEEKRRQLLEALQTIEKSVDDKFYNEMIRNELDILARQLDTPQDKINEIDIMEIQKWTINSSVMASLANKKEKQLKEKIYHVPQRIPLLLQVREFIKLRSFDNLELYLNDLNKKQVVIPYETVADILIKEGAKESAVRLVLQIPKMEERVTILLKIDEAKKAAKSIFESKKNYDLLQMIKDQCRDQGVINFIDEQLASRGK